MVQYPCRVGEEQAVRVVENHAGGTRGGLATCLRSDAGNGEAGVDSSASNTVEGRSLETSMRQSYDGPAGLPGQPG